MDECWLYEWIDEFGISSKEEVRRALKSPAAVARLFDIAVVAAMPYERENLDFTREATLVAGQGFNLAGESSCARFACVRQEIDVIMSRAWHYFEKIVVSGPSPVGTVYSIGEAPKKAQSHYNWLLENEVMTLLYLREIGATPWLRFVPNSNLLHCRDCMQKLAIEGGFSSGFDEDLRSKVISQLDREARIAIKRQSGLWNATVAHPLLVEPMSYKFTKRPDRRQVAARIYDVYNDATIVDVVKARSLNLPLAANVQANWLDATPTAGGSAVEDRMGRVALQLELPVIEGLIGKDLLAYIEQEREIFTVFRAALRKAVQENISRLDSKSDAEIAAAVKQEYLDPEIARISAKLNSSRRSLTKKMSVGVGVGSLVMSVGLVAAMPLIIGAGIAAAATPLPQVFKYFDDSPSVDMSDMYFLWKMQRDWNR